MTGTTLHRPLLRVPSIACGAIVTVIGLLWGATPIFAGPTAERHGPRNKVPVAAEQGLPAPVVGVIDALITGLLTARESPTTESAVCEVDCIGNASRGHMECGGIVDSSCATDVITAVQACAPRCAPTGPSVSSPPVGGGGGAISGAGSCFNQCGSNFLTCSNTSAPGMAQEQCIEAYSTCVNTCLGQ